MKVVHRCKVQCYSLDKEKADSLGIEDKGKWLPFLFDLGSVDVIKMTTDEPDSEVFNCTTVFLRNGNTYIIDTHFEQFAKIFEDYYNNYGTIYGIDFPPPPPDEDDNFEL
jgi:hypothetical protein